MDNYIDEIKINLIDAKSELEIVINLLDDALTLNEDIFQKEEVSSVYKDINLQINNLNSYILPLADNN